MEGPLRELPFDAVQDAITAGHGEWRENIAVLDEYIEIVRVTIQ